METYFIDANVILRFLTGTPEDMAARALELFEKVDAGEIELKLDKLVVAEIYWVLDSYYEFPREKIKNVLVDFFQSRGIKVEARGQVIEALKIAADKNVDFVDAVLAVKGRDNQKTIITFDKTDFSKLPADWKFPD